MSNRITGLGAYDRTTPPSDAELLLFVVAEQITATTEVRGRVTGPHCLEASTVEIAYPLRPAPFARDYPELKDGLLVQATIPEASLWEPSRPFLYQVFIELWEDGQCCERTRFAYGFRTIQAGSRSLLWNGQPCLLRGTSRLPGSEQELAALRQRQCNLLVAPASDSQWWSKASQIGFLVLGRLPSQEETWESLRAGERQASGLGWLIDQETLQRLSPESAVLKQLQTRRELAGTLIGVELCRGPEKPLPQEIDFVVCPEGMPPGILGEEVPRIVLVDGPQDTASQGRAHGAGLLGWIET
jgi:Glycosyl hydrolases family 2